MWEASTAPVFSSMLSLEETETLENLGFLKSTKISEVHCGSPIVDSTGLFWYLGKRRTGTLKRNEHLKALWRKIIGVSIAEESIQYNGYLPYVLMEHLHHACEKGMLSSRFSLQVKRAGRECTIVDDDRYKYIYHLSDAYSHIKHVLFISHSISNYTYDKSMIYTSTSTVQSY